MLVVFDSGKKCVYFILNFVPFFCCSFNTLIRHEMELHHHFKFHLLFNKLRRKVRENKSKIHQCIVLF